ncbi:MAG: hypothetical protein QM723_07695 [Myxococcaceae bacterium]
MRYALLLVTLLLAPAAFAAEAGDVIQTDTLGANVATWNLSKSSSSNFVDTPVVSEWVGAHYFISSDVRVGANFQFAEQLGAMPKAGGRVRTFAVLPQVGWNFHPPFFVAGIFTLAPRTGGGSNLALGVQPVIGAAFSLSSFVKLTVTLQVPYTFFPDQTVGITAHAGISVTL